MKLRRLIAANWLLVCSGCVAYYPYYYNDPYYYPYGYGAYYPYRPPAVYVDPGWLFYYPQPYFGYYYHGHHHFHHGRGWR